MNVRLLGAADAPAFRALRLRGLETDPRSFASSPDEEQDEEGFRAYLAKSDEGTFVVGAFDEAGALVGVVGVREDRHAKMRHKAHVWGVYVAPEARRRGVGNALMRAAIERARRRAGCLQMDLGVDTENAPAVRLYASCGFVRYGVDRRGLVVDGVAVDEALMTLWF